MTGERTSGRTTVYCAADSFVCAHGVTRKGRVALASDVCVAAHPDSWGVVGSVDAGWADRIAVMGDAATIDRLIDHISPIGAAGSSTAAEPAVIPHRGPGRPGWTTTLFRRRWHEAVTRGNVAEPATYPMVAGYFEDLGGAIGVIDPEYLGTLARKWGAG